MNSTNQSDKFTLRWGVILIPLLIFGTVILLGFINAKAFVDILWGYFEWLMVNLGWAIDLGALGFVIFSVVLMLHPIGKIKFGGQDAKPEFNTWNWWAMSLCAGMAMGIVMWPPEALMHSISPAQGMNLEPGSHEAILWAMRTTFLHWTFTPYAIYVVCGVLIAYAHYNLKKPYAVSSALYPLLGERAFGATATIVDALTLFAITGGVAGSLGMGMMQLGSGLEFVFGIQPGPMVWVMIAVVIVASYTTSSVTGLNKGIKWLSDKNAWLFIALMVFAFVFGPKAFILNLTTQAFGQYINHFFEAMTFTDPFPGGDLWPQWWDMFWFTDWLSFAPIVGMFLARLCYGRTIREFLVVNMVMPAVFGIMWFGVFGSITVYSHYFGGADLAALMEQKGWEVLMLKIFDFLPLANIIRPIMIITIFISFVTLADSMTSTVSILSTTGYEQLNTKEPPIGLKIFWGVLMGLTSIIFVFNGGLDGIKVVKTMAGIPILFLEILMVIGFITHQFKKSKATNKVFEPDSTSLKS
ncbi:MAG: glycine betaine transporter [Clostridia bacterium]|nr:glycine betaine transporter [Clostridia bacterium]